MRNTGRETAFQHLLSAWEEVFKAVKSGNANTDDHDYYYNKDLFEKALHYIEGFDRRYLKDGKTMSEIEKDYE